MPFFSDADDVYRHIGRVFREAGEADETSAPLRAAGIVLRLQLREPEAVITVRFGEPFRVDEGASDLTPDVRLEMPADLADRYWRGEYNLAVGLAKRQVQSHGPVNKLLKLVPLTKPLYPRYRELVAGRDAEVAA